MTPKELTAGIYTLKEEVSNVARDRRERHDWRKTTDAFKAGAEFIVELERTPDILKGMGVETDAKMELYSIRLKGSRFTHQDLKIWSHETYESDRAEGDKNYRLLWALLPHLERAGDVPLPAPTKSELLEALQTLRAACVDRGDEGRPAAEAMRVVPSVEVLEQIDAILARSPSKAAGS
ncbi:hypothetical protein ABIC83_002939 [Roseateles asaccharophilus]|uniref:hypothetical protein n=1 Tax=Roseateles asaccharophilus TaxID=582607 RepID=UPI003834EE5C